MPDPTTQNHARQLTTSVERCARCTKNHTVDWYKFNRACGDSTHWGLCPNTGEPILMQMKQRTT